MDAFPPHQQQQIRVQLSMTIIGVLSQQLAAGDQPGRVGNRDYGGKFGDSQSDREGKTRKIR